MPTTSSRDNQDHSYFHVCDLAVKLLHHPPLPLNSDDLATMGIEVAAMDIKTGNQRIPVYNSAISTRTRSSTPCLKVVYEIRCSWGAHVFLAPKG
jgi:hypothetical protein